MRLSGLRKPSASTSSPAAPFQRTSSVTTQTPAAGESHLQSLKVAVISKTRSKSNRLFSTPLSAVYGLAPAISGGLVLAHKTPIHAKNGYKTTPKPLQKHTGPSML